MARSALKIGVRELAAKAIVSPATITRIESGHPANASTLRNLEMTLRSLGVTCTLEESGSISVTLSSSRLPEDEYKTIQKVLLERREAALKTAQNIAKIKARDEENRRKKSEQP